MKKFSLLLLGLLSLLLAACDTSQVTTVISSTKLVGYQVVDLEGNTIARIEDFLIAADSGQISYAVVILRRDPFSYGKAAFVEAAVPRAAIPWDYLSLDSVSKQLQFKVDSSILYAAPLLKDRPNQLEIDWDKDVQAYWQAYAATSEHK